jgi:hypothetical protein
MMAAISSAVLSAGTFVATGVHTRRRSSKKVDFGLLEIYICLTNQRLLIFKTNWIGRPRELWASFDLKDIDTVELKMKKMFWQLPAIKLKLKNDEKIGFWSAKTYKKRTLRLVKKLQELVS